MDTNLLPFAVASSVQSQSKLKTPGYALPFDSFSRELRWLERNGPLYHQYLVDLTHQFFAELAE